MSLVDVGFLSADLVVAFGRARAFLTVWATPIRAPFLAVIRSATVNDQAATAFRQFVTSALLTRVAEPLGVSRIRLETAVAQVVGIALLRYVIRLEPMASAAGRRARRGNVLSDGPVADVGAAGELVSELVDVGD